MISPFKFFSRTANGSDMRLSVVICTANIEGAQDGDWVEIAPYGDHPSPDGSYVQKFSREQAEKVVRTWNSITGTAARVFKNCWHGLGPRATSPVWDGHPETNKQRWPREKLLAEISDIRTGNTALEGKITWSAKRADRPSGPLYPSPLWWHWPPAGEPPAVYPELLESVGLVATPNISSVPAWTQNATLASESEAENQPNNIMDKSKIISLLGLASDASDELIYTAISNAHTGNAALQTANSAKTDAEAKFVEATGKLTTANAQLTQATGQVTALTSERDNLQTTNAALIAGALNLAEAKGAIAPAERDAFKGKLTANAQETLDALKNRKAFNTTPVEINGNRVDLSTANARASALEGAVVKTMKDLNCDRDTAFGKVYADPTYAGLFQAMADPTKRTA